MATETLITRYRAAGLAAKLALAGLTLTLNAVPHVHYDGQPAQVSSTGVLLEVEGRIWRLPCFSDRPLDRPDPAVERAVILIHGIERRADLSLDALRQAARSASRAESHTLLLAPQFVTETDIDARPTPLDVPFWTGVRWAQGDDSASTNGNPRHGSVSSFGLMDRLLESLADRGRFPRLGVIVVAGHSAGGQFVNRYAAGGRAEEELLARGLRLRYVVANPGSYLYMSDERPVEGAPDSLARPSPKVLAKAPYYNNYKYGLNRLNRYMRQTGAERIRARYPSREVVYLLGDRDNDPKHVALDRSPSALLQGPSRKERGLAYYRHLLKLYGPDLARTQRLEIVPNAGHSARRMLDSAPGARWLFDFTGAQTARGTGAVAVAAR